MYTKGLFIAALAAITANAATVRQMASVPTTYAQTQTAVGSGTTVVSSSCDDDSYCFRNTGCISTRWDQQIQETNNPSWLDHDFCADVGSFRCPECSCDGGSSECEITWVPNFTPNPITFCWE